MGKVHVVQLGDHLPKLAAAAGFADVAGIWDHPRNAELKALRGDCCILYPGDQIFLPDKQSKSVMVPTGKTETVVVSQPKIRLSMVIQDAARQPLANVPCELRTETDSFPLVLDERGQFDQEIPVDAESCHLVIRDAEVHLLVGHLPPIDLPIGRRARLNNLGYEAGALDDACADGAGESADPDADRAWRSAVEEFQCDQGIPVTGVFDAATQAKLLEAHGC